MKTVLLLLLALMMYTPSLLSQEDNAYEETPSSRSSSGGIFGGGGGIVPTWYFVNTKGLNEELTRLGFPVLKENGMFLMGGHGYAYIIIIPNFRIGGIGAGGSIESTQSLGEIYRAAKFSTSFGGVTLEYVIPFGRFHIAFGGMLGGGSNELALTRTSSETRDWNDVTFGGKYPLYQVYSNSFFSYQPSLTIEFDVSPFIVVSANTGYYGSSGRAWKLDDHFEIQNVPDFKLSGTFLRLGLTVGLFIGE